MCRTKLGRKEKRKERKKVEEERGGREKENKKNKVYEGSACFSLVRFRLVTGPKSNPHETPHQKAAMLPRAGTNLPTESHHKKEPVTSNMLRDNYSILEPELGKQHE